jgi:hypothetical protein
LLIILVIYFPEVCSSVCSASNLATYSSYFIALLFTAAHCCDRHPDSEIKFDLQMLLPGPLLRLMDEAITSNTKRKHDGSDGNPEPRKKYRPVKERDELDARLIRWLTQEHERDSALLFRTQYDILSLSHRTTLVRTRMEEMTSPETIMDLLGETDEWRAEFASKIFELIQTYETSLPKKNSRKRASAR